MTLYVDGDAFPNRLKQILFRAVERYELRTVVVANKQIDLGCSSNISYIIVSEGADEADHRIVEMVEAGDLVITADIPLADRVIAKKAYAIDQRGKQFTVENIKQYLAMRNLLQDLRDLGEHTKGPASFGPKEANQFANQLDSFLTKYYKA